MPRNVGAEYIGKQPPKAWDHLPDLTMGKLLGI